MAKNFATSHRRRKIDPSKFVGGKSTGHEEAEAQN